MSLTPTWKALCIATGGSCGREMFWGPEQLKSTNLPPVAIVGSGPAGLTIGAALADLKIPSLILEAGDEDYDHDVQADYQGE